MKRTTFLWVASAMMVAAGCKENAPPPKPQTAPASRPVAAGPTADARRADARLGMMERYAIWKAKREAEEKAAAEAKSRLMQFDFSKLDKHQALFAFEKETRAALDKALVKLNGKLDADDQIKKLAASQQKSIESQADAIRAMDPTGTGSGISKDHDVILNLLVFEYPSAIIHFFRGQTKPLAEVRAEMDKREEKISAWLVEVQKYAKEEAEKGAKEEGAKEEAEKGAKEEVKEGAAKKGAKEGAKKGAKEGAKKGAAKKGAKEEVE